MSGGLNKKKRRGAKRRSAAVRQPAAGTPSGPDRYDGTANTASGSKSRQGGSPYFEESAKVITKWKQ